MGPRIKRRLPKYVHGYLDRHGKPRHYLRRRGRKEVPLPPPSSPDFTAAYESALNEALPIIIGASRTRPGTVEEAVARYLGSAAFTQQLAPSSQAMRRRILERLRAEHGDKRLRYLEAEHVARLLGRLRPWVQRNFMKTLRGLMAFSLTEGLIDTDPTVGVKLARVKDTGGFTTWPQTSIQQYRAHHQLGTRARLALELLYNTMGARADTVQLGRQHVQASIISFRRQKTGNPVDIPILPELQAAIDAMPKAEHLTFLVTERGQPFTPAGFGNWFRDQCDAAGLSNLSAHGLRKSGATRLAEAGATDHEIMAWGGWTSVKEVQRYTKAANRKRLALQAADKLKARTEVANLDTRLANQNEKS
jgi:integrase